MDASGRWVRAGNRRRNGMALILIGNMYSGGETIAEAREVKRAEVALTYL
ncbi:hypothetical protein [Sphingobium sp. SCG-1]|nr:hypothetical protein [Sphingobium sp. SCG-1]